MRLRGHRGPSATTHPLPPPWEGGGFRRREGLMSTAVTRGDVARGAGLAGLARAGALIEAVAQALYTWLFGLATYGLYVVLWGAVNLTSNIVDLAMTHALQRVVPTESDEGRHGAVKAALIIG